MVFNKETCACMINNSFVQHKVFGIWQIKENSPVELVSPIISSRYIKYNEL